MTCLEHLIENCLSCMEDEMLSPDDIESMIEKDVNLPYSGITSNQCYEICSYIRYTYLPCRYYSDVERSADDTGQ